MATREQVLVQYKSSLPDKVMGFFEEHRPLSNFHLESFTWREIIWPSSENAYQAAKTDASDWPRFAMMSPSESRRAGQKAKLVVKNWDDERFRVMSEILKFKFSSCPIAQRVLISTCNVHLEECNWWGDRYYGTVNGDGFNALGKILMKIREEYKTL
jgi:ribA/ribD-fused uncharacterized protein